MFVTEEPPPPDDSFIAEHPAREAFDVQISAPLTLFIVLLTLAFLIMLPTAGALYYSKCLNVSMLMGFGIIFSTLLVSLFSLLLPEVIRGNVISTASFAYGVVTIYAVFIQIMGGCNF
jgi:hypothetical protein